MLIISNLYIILEALKIAGGLIMNWNNIENLIITYGWKFILSIIVLIVGRKLIKHLVNLVEKSVVKSKIDKSLHSFFMSATRVSLHILLVVTVASMLGVKDTSFVAIIGSGGLAVGLALQGSLANFAGGVLILLLKPFKVGDYIEGAGYSGTVEEIQVFYTILNTIDNKKVYIPNGNLSNSSTINYSANPTRRIDLTFGAGYDDDAVLVKKVLYKIAEDHDKVLDDPKPYVRLAEYGDSSVNFLVRIWCKTEDYWDVYYDLIEKVKIEFDKNNINIPYPQMDVHVLKNN